MPVPIRTRVLQALAHKAGWEPVRLSQIGEAVVQDGASRSAQGLALAVAPVVRRLMDDALVDKDGTGYFLTPLGLATAQALDRPEPTASRPRRRR